MALFNSDAEAKRAFADILCEFLEVAFNGILYSRRLYPREAFERRQKYRIPVWQSADEQLSSYIENVLQSIRHLMLENDAEQVALVIVNSYQKPIERFLFEVIPSIKKDCTLSQLEEMEQAFREFLLKLGVSGSEMKPLPEDCRFTIQMLAKKASVERLVTDAKNTHFQSFPMVRAEKHEILAKASGFIPLKSYSSQQLQMQLFVEEDENLKLYEI